jgi:hypothetical protein
MAGATGGTFVVPGFGTVVGVGGGALAGGVAGASGGFLTGAVLDIVHFARRSGRSLKREWERLNGVPWPTGCQAHHTTPLADGSADCGTNIEPLTPEDHRRHHKENDDFKRWGERGKKESQKDPEDPSSRDQWE